MAIDAAIVAAAWRMFLDEGYSATSMKVVAARAGVSKGTLYARFDTKASLFAAVIAQRVATWSAEASQQDFRLGNTLEERIEHHATIFLSKITSPEVAGLTRLVIAESGRFPELGRIVHDKAFAFAVDLIAKELLSGTPPGELQPRNMRGVAAALIESLFGWATLQAVHSQAPSASARRRIAKQRVAILLKGRAAWASG